jgi:hypothetical protein
MQQIIRLSYGAALLLAFILPGCSKETPSTLSQHVSSPAKTDHAVKRDYKDHFDTWFQFVPDIENGWDPQNPTPFLAWYPGGGTGNATHIGNAHTFFNQYVPFNPPLFSSVHAPINMFFAQQLMAAGIEPLSNDVSSIVYDMKGNSIWFHQNSNSTVPVSASRIEFTGTSSIIGGSGKFAGANGEVMLKGYFNPMDNDDAAVSADGWIRY